MCFNSIVSSEIMSFPEVTSFLQMPYLIYYTIILQKGFWQSINTIPLLIPLTIIANSLLNILAIQINTFACISEKCFN